MQRRLWVEEQAAILAEEDRAEEGSDKINFQRRLPYLRLDLQEM